MTNGSSLYRDICDRYVSGIPIADMRSDLARAFRLLTGDSYDTDQLKKMLNDHHLPTVSGRARWTVAEIRRLIR